MKKIFFILLVFISFQGVSQSVKLQEIKLEVMTEDLGKRLMGWDEAKKACDSLGGGWRLPTINELEKINKFKDKIGEFQKKDGYWSSTPNGPNARFTWDFSYGNGRSFDKLVYYGQYVRAVRTIK